ncbi:putative sulfate exporter family transporter [Pontiellaceae bacterium B12219]|nr:putative sulfate exporter family transporter [Pontiellaceae bacterium B12219]
MKTKLPGILLAIALGIVAFAVSRHVHALNTVCTAILIGMVWGNLFERAVPARNGLDFTERHILPVAIALMGLELNFATLHDLGWTAVLIVIPAMAASILSAVVIGRLLKLPARTALLLGVGNSVCGSSAILAAAPTIKPEKHDCAVAIAAVNLMGTIGLFVLPHLALMLELGDIRTAYLLGGSLQAVGQVAAAGLSVSDWIGNQAVVIKMLRVLMIGPIILMLSVMLGSKARSEGRPRSPVPGYIIGFAVCALLGSLFRTEQVVLLQLRTLGGGLMVMAMVAIGSKIQFKTLLRQGSKALIITFCSSLVLVSVVLLLSVCFTGK